MSVYKKHTNKLRWLITAGAVFAALAASVFILLSFKSRYLVLSNAMNEDAIFCEEISEGERFSVSFTHSVNKSPVSEHYELRGETIYLTELRYRAFGAGMPTEPDEGQSLRYEDGDMVIYGFEREMTDLCYSIGRVAGHTLHYRSREIPLNALDEPGQPVSFDIAVYPRLLVWCGLLPR